MSRRRHYHSSDGTSFCCLRENEEEWNRPLLLVLEEEKDTKLAVRTRLQLLTVIAFLLIITVAVSFLSHAYSRDVSTTVHDCSVQHIHLAQRTNVHDTKSGRRVAMTVSFAVNRTCGSPIHASIVYGRELFPDEEVTVVVEESPIQFNYTSQSQVSDVVFYSDWLYHVALPDLVAGEEEYWYQIRVMGDKNNKKAHSKKISFRTPPLPGHPTAFAVVGDLGQTEHSLRTMQQILNATTQNHNELLNQQQPHPISHLIIAGDMSYADSDPWRWPSWFQLMEPLWQTTPIHVAAGNHEIECNTQTNDIFIPYEHYFYNPNRIASAQMNPITDQYRDSLWRQSCSTPSEFLGYYVYGNSFYAYRHGLVHVIVLNSYTYSGVGSEQYTWLEEELRLRFDRTVTPWLMIVFHCPFYSTFDSHVDEAQSRAMKRSMEPLFLQYGVNFVISGHDHAYLRTRSMKYGQVDSTQHAPIYFIVGAGGNREGHPNGYRRPDHPEPWVAKRTIVDWGYGHWWIPNATHAHFAWIPDGFEMTEKDGTPPGDDVWFVNPHVTSFQ